VPLPAPNRTNLWAGISWSNATVKSRGQPPIYCAPDEISLQADQVVDILRRRVQAATYLGNMYAGMAMIDALQKTFPCQR
jgi:hypothetical protein